MEYKGYVAAVEFDDSIEVLHGRVVNSGPYPIVTFEATDATGIRREFERSVDEYLAGCAEDGVEPLVPRPSPVIEKDAPESCHNHKVRGSPSGAITHGGQRPPNPGWRLSRR